MWLAVLIGALLFVWAIKEAFGQSDAYLHADAPENQNHFIVRNNSGAGVKVAMCESPQCGNGGGFLADPIRPGNIIDLTAPWVSNTQLWLVLSTPSDSRVGCLSLNNHHKHSKPRQILVTSFHPCPV